jgi:hypothetical protein
MAYREVEMMDIDQVIRRWLAGEKIRANRPIYRFRSEHGAANRALGPGSGHSAGDAVAGGRQAAHRQLLRSLRAHSS